MPGTSGAQSIPFPVAVPGFAPGDPALTYLGQFLQAAINASVGTLWGSSGVCPGRDVVAHVFWHDPTQGGGFDESRLPALYIWRGRRPARRTAADIRTATSRIDVGWIMEPSQEEHYRARAPMFNAIMVAIEDALATMRCKSWIVPGDTDPAAATSGSMLLTWTGFESITLGDTAPRAFDFGRVDGDSRPLPFYGFSTSLDVVENHSVSLADRAPAAVQMDITANNTVHYAWDDPLRS